MRILTGVLIFIVAVIIFNRGSEYSGKPEYSDETEMVILAIWTDDKENIPDMIDAIYSYDEEFLDQQIVDGKVKQTDKEIKIAVEDVLNDGNVVKVKFLQGRYKNKTGYTAPEFVRDVKEARDLKEKAEKARQERRQVSIENEKAKDDARIKQLANGLTIPLKNGVQINYVLDDSADSSYKLIGATNLPDGTKINVTLGNFQKSTQVQDGGFSIFFSKRMMPVGEQKLSITTLNKSAQSSDVLIADNELARNGDESFLGKQVYSGTVQVK